MKRILLIDDDEDEFGIFKEALDFSEGSYDCVYAQTVDEALDMLQHFIPDYIFIDFNMPQKSGLQCLVEIRKIKAFDLTPVILYSTGINNILEQKAIALGATECIKKTQTIAKLRKILSELLANTG